MTMLQKLERRFEVALSLLISFHPHGWLIVEQAIEGRIARPEIEAEAMAGEDRWIQ